MTTRAFVDSELVDEIYRVVDPTRAIEGVALTMGLFGTPEERCLRVRGVLWLAMALDGEGAVTTSPRAAVVPAAKPGTWGAAWMACWPGFVRRAVCPGWHSEVQAVAMAELAADDVPVVTRDGRRATAVRGLTSFSPEAYAAARLPLDQARARFFERFDAASLDEAAAGAARGGDGAWPTRLEHEAMQLGQIRNLYAYIWRERPGD